MRGFRRRFHPLAGHPLRAAVLVAGGIALALQFVPVAGYSNPPSAPADSLQTRTAMPPDVAALLDRACADCHSHATRWPWYSRVAPASWVLAGDVERARRKLNFSQWAERQGRKPAVAASTLLAFCAVARTGAMPPPSYRVLHPEAVLSPQELDRLCAWTTGEARRLLRSRKRS